jgi:hypothetical protein
MPTSPKNLKLTNTKCTVRATTTALFSFLNHTSLKSEVIRFNYIRQVSSELCFPVESIQRYKAKKMFLTDSQSNVSQSVVIGAFVEEGGGALRLPMPLSKVSQLVVTTTLGAS